MTTITQTEPKFYYGNTLKRRFSLFLTYVALTFLSLIFIIPLIWLFLTSLMPLQQIGAWPPKWMPDPVQWENYSKALHFWNFERSFWNTTIITVLSMIGELLSCTLVAYGFARLRFPGRNILFVILLSTMMLPFAVRMVPLYIGFAKIGWVNTFLPLIIPAFFANPFFVFLLRQFFLTIPEELVDAARIDGASEFRIWARIMVPLSAPALIVVGIFSFQNAWNDFLAPLIYLNDERLHTLALGLYSFRAMPGQGSLYNQMMAASVLMVLPMLVVFAVFQRYFVQGVTLTGLKG
jgi:multiple sugar transport system permease protein